MRIPLRSGARVAVSGQACKYLECVNGSWQCPPEGGVTMPEASTSADAAGDGG